MVSMGNFDRENRSGGGRSYGGSRSGGGGRSFGGSRSGGGGRSFGGGSRDFGQRGDREMHHAVCSNCGKDCEVPFKPTGSKPVLCSDCFAKNRDSEPRRFSDRGDSAPRRDFAPREGGGAQNSKQLEVINAKLDQVLALLNGAPKGKAAPKVVEAPKVPKVAKAVKAPKVEATNLDVSDILESTVTPEVDPNNSIDSVKEE